MTRLVVRTFALLIGVVVLSLCFLSTRLLVGINRNRRTHFSALPLVEEHQPKGQLFDGPGQLFDGPGQLFDGPGQGQLLPGPRRGRLFDNPGEWPAEREWRADGRRPAENKPVQEIPPEGDVANVRRHQEARVAARRLDTAPDDIPVGSDETEVREVAVAEDKMAAQEIHKHKLVVRVPDVVSVSGHRICAPEKSIAMIKTHKCSSSTLQNILLRKAEDLNLTVAVPREGVYLGSPDFFRRGYILGDLGRTKYNIMASHMRFTSPRDVQQVMATGAKYVTILRNPAEQYESMYTYYGWKSRYHVNMQRFLSSPERLFRIFEPRRTRNAGRNPMCYDNGLDTRTLTPGSRKFGSFVNLLSEWYDLVLIAEYFEESLILLKELMCWTLDDIVYFSQNARNKESVVALSPQDRAAIREWNWADTELYDHFNATLWAKVDLYGREKMTREVAKLQEKNKVLADDCIGEVLETGDKRIWYPNGIKINSFALREDSTHRGLCEQLVRPELAYLKLFQDKIKKTPEYLRVFGADPQNVRRRDHRRAQVQRHWVKHPV